MRLTVDLDTLHLITSATDRKRVTLLEFKRGDVTPLEVQFVRSGVAEALPDGSVLAFGSKETKKYDGDFAVFFDEFAEPTATPDFIYAGTPSFNTETLDDLLVVDGDDSNDKASVDLMGELSWAIADADPVSIRTFTVRVHNDVIRGDEGTPIATPSPVDWLAAHGIVYDPAIVGLTGGGATKLDGIVTVGASVGRLQAVMISTELQVFILTAGTTAEDAELVIRPDDYNAGTNAKVWRLWLIKALTITARGVVVTELQIEAPDLNLGIIRANNITGSRDYELPDRDGTFVPFIDIAANTTDNAGLALVTGVFKLVLRHQTANTWHELKVVDSGGTPTLSISNAL
jgi:hypothetical protein